MSVLSNGSADARIEVRAPLGTEIILADGGYATVARGITQLTGSFRDGTYSLTLSAGERSRQWIIRLRSNKLWRFPDDLPPISGGQRDDGSVADPRFAAAARYLAVPSNFSSSGISILVTSADFEPEAELSRFVRIGASRDHHDTLSPSRHEILSNGWALMEFEAAPGEHMLSIETFERKRIEQPLMVFSGRRSILLLEYGQTSIVEQKHSNKWVRKRRGIDPARTIIVTHESREGERALAERFGVAAILLYLLRSRIRPVDAGVAKALLGPEIDPLLKLYAAAGCIALPGTVIDRLASSVAPKMFPEGSAPAEAIAAMLHRELEDYRWPDVMCLGWRLEEQRDGLLLSGMPMLELCWRWAVAHSARFRMPRIVDPSAPGANRQTEADASPWLTINSSGVASSIEDISQLDTIAPDLAAMANNLATTLASDAGKADLRAPGSENPASLDLSLLSVPTARLVHAIANAGGMRRWGQGDAELLPHLAASLGEPLGRLGATIRDAAAEVQELIDRQMADPDALWNSDPHKGAFGGRRECGGAKVELEAVAERDQIESYALEFLVSTEPGSRPLEGPVTFYLHPTFSPSVISRRPIDGLARFTCYAWGAFTLGVETSDGRRMELDLAEELYLPEAFRAR